MTTRRRLLLLSLVTTTGVLGFGYWQFWPRTAITLENSQKIELGMTLGQVEAILGGPARNESTWNDNEKMEFQENQVHFAMPRKLWISDDVIISVTFEEELVFWSEATVLGGQREPFIETIRRWMHLDRRSRVRNMGRPGRDPRQPQDQRAERSRTAGHKSSNPVYV